MAETMKERLKKANANKLGLKYTEEDLKAIDRMNKAFSENLNRNVKEEAEAE